MDWITKLPPSSSYDSILTITDHDCSKAVLFIPCKEAMGTKELAKLYFNKVFPHYGIPGKIISDRDPRLTSHLAKQICKEANIDQNISMAYHPQTDGQSERTNQTLETFLRIFCNEQQNDWARWLPLAQYALNTRPSHTTKIPPFEALIGVVPKANATPTQPSSPLVSQKEKIEDIQKRTHEAILHSQMLLIKDSNFRPYKEGEQVWLDAKNLKTMHPTHKLRAKRYGPFTVSKAISHVAYQLKLPKTWKIHNVFHASYLSPYWETPEHGPNYLELPPNIIEGQPEWEIEAIIGMCFFGQRKEKQYRVHWKGYSNAHDTWEPEQNIHAPELLTEYHRNQTIHIRATRIEEKGDMFRPSHFEAPKQHPSAEPTSHPTTPSSVYVQILGARYSQRIIPLVAQRLEQGPLIPKVVAHPVLVQESI